jgi:hypothetical protein
MPASLNCLAAVALLFSLSNRTLSQAAEPADSDTPAAQYQRLTREYDDTLHKFLRASEEERSKLEYPKPETVGVKLLELARQHRHDPAAADAAFWVAAQIRHGTTFDQALELILRDHLKSDKVQDRLWFSLMYAPSPQAEKVLRGFIDQHPDPAIQGKAMLSLGKHLKSRTRSRNPGEAAPDHAEALFEQVLASHGDVAAWNGTLGEMATAELYEIRNLAIGKVAPEIEGEDVDGKSFKLSDYRGKVVVIDFWGDW